jgi:hypothetical protein
MKVLLLTCIFFCELNFSGFNNKRIYLSDFKNLSGQKWIGSLTYLDYSTNKKTLIAANLSVIQSSNDKHVWYFKNEYPREPQANSIDTVRISRDGKMLSEESVKERKRLDKIIVRIVTEKNYIDNGKEKVFRFTYLISKNKFSIRKEDKGKKDTSFIERNIYEYQRK